MSNFRERLGFFERRKLEKQFGEQVPQYSEFCEKKRSLESQSNTVSAILGAAFAYGTHSKTHQPIAAVFAFGVAFVTGKFAYQTFGPTLSGLKKYNKHEYERAFDLWVYYKNRGVEPIEGAEQRYQERFNAWKKLHVETK